MDSRPGQIEIESDLFPADRVLKGGVNNVTKLGVRVLPGDVQNNRGQGAKFILKGQGQFCETFENFNILTIIQKSFGMSIICELKLTPRGTCNTYRCLIPLERICLLLYEILQQVVALVDHLW